MNPVGRALWFIESHFAGDISLDDIAAVGGVSRFHLSRVFGVMTGRSVMGYVRARRLTEAARALAGGAPDILSVALEAGYGSHEAFTRAFRDQFGVTPEEVRGQRHVTSIALVEPMRMDQTTRVKLDPPRTVDGKPFVVAGLGARYTFATMNGIPAQWQRFAPRIGNVPGEVAGVAYGVIHDMSGEKEGFGYLAGVEVAGEPGLPKELTSLRIPAHRYAVFLHRGHISTIRETMGTIYNEWLPQLGEKVVDELPDFFERYDERFDPHTGMGEVEIWIPVKA